MSSHILTNKHEQFLEITLNRPEVYNALNLDVMVTLSDTLASAAPDESIKGVLLTGKGKAFCAGGDWKHNSNWSVRESASVRLIRMGRKASKPSSKNAGPFINIEQTSGNNQACKGANMAKKG